MCTDNTLQGHVSGGGGARPPFSPKQKVDLGLLSNQLSTGIFRRSVMSVSVIIAPEQGLNSILNSERSYNVIYKNFLNVFCEKI